jgi:hypothetical protein
MPRGLFVSFRGFLGGIGGGVQLCTQEYIDVITAAGFALEIIPLDGDRRLTTRVMRKLNSSPYFRPTESSVFEKIRHALARSPADFVFLNQVSLSPIATRLRDLAPASTRIVLLSHGLESTDLLHLLRLRRQLPLSGRARPSANAVMGRVLRTEATSRENVDAVVALSPFDVEAEHWIGARRVEWLPRTISQSPLNWRPTGRRLGFVGTLDHAPNLEGLVMVLDEIVRRSSAPPIVRIVSGSHDICAWLVGRYPFVQSLGGLDDEKLRDEAATWSGFLNPIFCYSRGCTTKLAAAIGWQIPIVTTPQGRRGYLWREGSLLEAEGVETFVDHAMAVLEPGFAAVARAEVARVGATSPTVAEVAARLRRFIYPAPAAA